MTRRRTDVRGIMVIFLAWVKHHIFFKGSTPPTVSTKPPFQRVLMARSLVVKRPERETDYSSHLVPRLKIYGLIPPFPHTTSRRTQAQFNLYLYFHDINKTQYYFRDFNLRPESKARNLERQVSYYSQDKQKTLSHAVLTASSFMASRPCRF